MIDRKIDQWRPQMDTFPPPGMLRELYSLQRTLDRCFDKTNADWPDTKANQWSNYGFVPPCDVEEKEGHYLLSMDLPGLNKADLKVQVQGDELTIAGQRGAEKKELSQARHYEERYHGSFKRTFSLPSEIDATKVEADYRDGVLRIAVPIAESKKLQNIRIGEGRAGLIGRLFHRPEEQRTKEVKVA